MNFVVLSVIDEYRNIFWIYDSVDILYEVCGKDLNKQNVIRSDIFDDDYILL